MNTTLKYLLFICLFVGSVAAQTATIEASAAAKVGQTATINVTADGTTPFTYQWKKDGTNIVGATANPFVLANVTLASAGSYSVTVTNSVGFATSNLAVLKIMVPPTFTLQPINTTTTVGRSATLSATATATPSPTYQWQKNGVTIVGATAASYTLASPVVADSGTYTCVATSVLDTLTESVTSNPATLTVSATPPTITNISITIK